MPKSRLKNALLLALLITLSPAMGATFKVEDLTGKQWCFGKEENWPKDSLFPRCSDYLPGSVGVVVTPEAGELPIECRENGNGGNFCQYAADIYVVARHHGQWLVKNGYTWRAVEFADLAPLTRWPPWSQTASMAYHIDVAVIDLNTSRAAPIPEGFEVWMGLSPSGSKAFTPALIHQVYPPPRP